MLINNNILIIYQQSMTNYSSLLHLNTPDNWTDTGRANLANTHLALFICSPRWNSKFPKGVNPPLISSIFWKLRYLEDKWMTQAFGVYFFVFVQLSINQSWLWTSKLVWFRSSPPKQDSLTKATHSQRRLAVIYPGIDGMWLLGCCYNIHFWSEVLGHRDNPHRQLMI